MAEVKDLIVNSNATVVGTITVGQVTPTENSQVATKKYVDDMIIGAINAEH